MEHLAVFSPRSKEYPHEAIGQPKFALISGKADKGHKTKYELIAEKVGSLIGVVGTLSEKLDNNQDHGAKFICITQGNGSFIHPILLIKLNSNSGRNSAVAVAVISPAPPTSNHTTSHHMLETFAAETNNAKMINLFPKTLPGDLLKCAFDGTKF